MKPRWSPEQRVDGAIIGVGLIVLGLALIPVQRRWAFNYQLIEYDRHFWMTMVIVLLGAIAAAEWAWRVVARRGSKVSLILGFAACIAAYNVVYPIVNGALDRAEAERHIYVISGRQCYVRKGLGRGRMWLAPLDPADRSIRLSVPRRFCRNARDGQQLVVDVKPGFLNTEWAAHYELRP